MTNTATPAPPTVAILGGGVMGGTLVTALRASGWPTSSVVVAERNKARGLELRDSHGVVIYDNPAEAVEGSDVVILAVKPQDAAATLSEIREHLSPNVLFVTVAAGLNAAFYEERLPEGTPVVRVMPNTPAVVAKGASAVAKGANATDDNIALVVGMLRATGLVVEVEEKEIDAVIAVSGSGPAYFFAIVEALTEAGVAQGLDRVLATRLAAQTFVGAAALLQHSGDTPAVLRQRVSSPGGTTLAALDAMSNAGLQTVIAVGANAAANRSRELAKELGESN